MEYALEQFEREVRAGLSEQGNVPASLIELETPKPGIPADLAFPTFALAKARRMPPVQLAQELAETIRFDSLTLVAEVTATGPYLNFRVEPSRFASLVVSQVVTSGPRYGYRQQTSDRTVVVEYSSPNMARRMHVGHIRSTIIGQALANIVAADGYCVVRDNHIGDWGKNFGLLITGIVHEGKPDGAGEEALAALEDLYARYTRLAEGDAKIDQEARDWSRRLERGDPLARELWHWIVGTTLAANQPLYDRLSVHFDTVLGESFFNDRMASLIERVESDDLAERLEDGALVVQLPEMPSFLLQRSDGGTLYHTRDLATIDYRVQEYRPRAIVYVVDGRQSLHFWQLFSLARAMGMASRETELIHVSFGLVVGSDGQPLAARRGNMVYLQSLLDEAHSRALAVVEAARPELSDDEKREIAEAVGIGAVIYNDLSQDPRRNISLDWDRMLSLEGNSAPYIQYMHARCCSVLRKAGLAPDELSVADARADCLVHPSEVALVKHIARLPEAIRQAHARYAPSEIATWCFECARSTSTFYRDCPVLAAETPELRAARLQLCAVAASSLRTGLRLLGIRAPTQM